MPSTMLGVWVITSVMKQTNKVLASLEDMSDVRDNMQINKYKTTCWKDAVTKQWGGVCHTEKELGRTPEKITFKLRPSDSHGGELSRQRE